MANAASPVSVLEMREVEATARRLSLEVATFEIRRAEDIAPTFEALKGRADALYVCGDPLVDTNRIRIITLALGARLPSVSDFPEIFGSSILLRLSDRLIGSRRICQVKTWKRCF